MPDWTNPKAYAFTAELDRTGWAWEFLRRNPAYRTDFANLPTAKSHYEPPRLDGESEQAWALRVTNAGLEAHRMTPQELLARKWRMTSPICDPYGDTIPTFSAFPIQPSFDEVKQYFEVDEPFRRIDEFAVLAFDLRLPIGPQLENAKNRLMAAQLTSSAKQPRKVRQTHWTIYLRLLDAQDAGATSKEIRAKLEQYFPESQDADHKHKAADKFGDHRRYAIALRDNPLSILFPISP